MKTIVCCMVGVACMWSCVAYLYAQNISENEYRSRWTKAEDNFAQQHSAEVSKEQKKKDVQDYLQMGKDYVDKKDYATALMCFRSVIELENELGSKVNIELAQAEIANIETQMQLDIKRDLNSVFGKGWPRREEGFKRILDRMPSTYTQKWAEEQEQKRIAAIEAEKKKVRDEMRKRKLDLEQQVLQKSLEVNEELYIKRLELLKRQVEVDELLRYAKELFAERSYAEVIVTADKALAIDPNSSSAKSIRDDARYRLEEEKIAVSKKEAETQRAIHEMKQKQAEDIRRKHAEDVAAHLAKGKDLFARNEFIDAITEFKNVLKLDNENLEAKLYIEQIKIKLEKTKTALENEAQETPIDTQVETHVETGVETQEGQLQAETISAEAVSIPLESSSGDLRKIPKTNLSIPVAKSETDSIMRGKEATNAGLSKPAAQVSIPISTEPKIVTDSAKSNETVLQTAPSASPAQSQAGAVMNTDAAAQQGQPEKTKESPLTTETTIGSTDAKPLTPGEILKSSGSK